jgi:superfamily I DNA/RNA helicase
MAQVLVAPTREVRNMEFDCVFLPFATKNIYPYPYKVMGTKHAGDRRKFYLAMTRAKSTLIISYNDKPSPYVKDIEAALGR